MSKVISFRLNPDNPREAEALAVIHKWKSQGFSTRHTLTEAILNMEFTNHQSISNEAMNDLLNQIKILMQNIKMESSFEGMSSPGFPSKDQLSDGFITSITKSAKPGVKIKS